MAAYSAGLRPAASVAFAATILLALGGNEGGGGVGRSTVMAILSLQRSLLQLQEIRTFVLLYSASLITREHFF